MSKCVNLIKKHEGLRLMPYKCTAGKLTIGYGRNIEDTGISEEEAEYLLESDIQQCFNYLQDKTDYFTGLSEPRQSVMVNMLFNLGWTRLNKFKNMIAAVKAGDYKKASVEMLDSRWAKQVGKRSTELAAIMESGQY